MITEWIILSALLAAEPAPSAPKTAPAKVYVVYVTVVEVDGDGNETVLFTPKIQTTGNPAGVTVEHVDGRNFEFNCKLATTPPAGLVVPPGDTATRPAAKLEPPKTAAVKAVPASLPGKPLPVNPLVAEKTGGVKPQAPPQPPVSRKITEYYVRTYDVSDLIETGDTLTEATFGPLMETIRTVALPDSWSGKATIRPFTSTKSLVIKQNSAGHAAVAAALAELRPRSLEK